MASPVHNATTQAPGGDDPASGQGADAAVAPQAGQTLGEFRLISKVGQGAHGSVFLARDLSLGRYVAVKVSPARGQEGQVLARLNHPHIVSVYREQIVGSSKLLAMQFVAGSNLQGWIRAVAGRDRADFDGAAFARWAAAVKVPEQVSEDVLRGELPIGDFVRIAVWLIHTVADALRHAHRRGVLHHDIKPANIMIDTGGQPLLTDFNVASLSEDATGKTVGGTITYMSPEHLQMLQAYMSGVAAASHDAIDVRSDVYSLAVVLYELLTGQVHWRPLQKGASADRVAQLLADRQLSGPPPLPPIAGITPALSAILSKALHPDPNRRYQDACQFATDLDCWLRGQPNRFAANPSARERTLRFAHRHRRSLSAALLAATAVLVLSGTVLWRERSRLRTCEQLAITANQELTNGTAARAAERLGRAESLLAQVVWLPYISPRRYHYTAEQLAAVSTQIARVELQRFRGQFGEIRVATRPSVTPADGAGLIENALRTYGVLQREDWQRREPFADLDAVDQLAVAENISELLLVSVLQSAARTAPSEQELSTVMRRFPAQHRELSVIRALASVGQPSFAFEPPAQRSVEDRFEAYLYGVVFTLEEDYRTARRWFQHSISLRQSGAPSRFWAHYWNAYACQRLGLSDEALIHYGICVGLRPDFSWPTYNMGLVCWDKQDRELAKQYMRQVMRVDPSFTPAYVSLGGMQYQEGEFGQAVQTYRRAIERGLESADIYNNLALARWELGQPAEALDARRRAAELTDPASSN
ncbi:protein kinase domain-containing protein [Roseimaritima ulvae]|nr:serine/threonine-protein kinase [Roseimaritima ulvae]